MGWIEGEIEGDMEGGRLREREEGERGGREGERKRERGKKEKTSTCCTVNTGCFYCYLLLTLVINKLISQVVYIRMSLLHLLKEMTAILLL